MVIFEENNIKTKLIPEKAQIGKT